MDQRTFDQLPQAVKHIAETFTMLTEADVVTGYHVLLPNGYTVSVQFGWATESDNQDFFGSALEYDPNASFAERATRAEIAVWDANEVWRDPDTLQTIEGSSVVKGWVSFEAVVALIERVAKL